jgi:hypothetical protein
MCRAGPGRAANGAWWCPSSCGWGSASRALARLGGRGEERGDENGSRQETPSSVTETWAEAGVDGLGLPAHRPPAGPERPESAVARAANRLAVHMHRASRSQR